MLANFERLMMFTTSFLCGRGDISLVGVRNPKLQVSAVSLCIGGTRMRYFFLRLVGM